MSTKGEIATGLLHLDSESCLEPLTMLVDQAHQRDRHIEQPRGEPDHPFVRFLLGCVEHTEVA